MGNEKNLVALTTEKAREIGRKGGIRSGEVRRQNKAVKHYIDLFMSKALKDEDAKEKLKELGITDEDINNKMAMVYVQWVEAMKGNTKAFENLLNYAGEKPVEQIQQIEPPKIVDDING